MEYADLVARSVHELQLKTDAHDAVWQMGEAAWSIDLDVGDLVFETPTGMVVTCPAQVVGTYDTTDSTWLWGWDHPSVDSPMAGHAEAVREYGKANGIAELTTRKLEVTEEKCWEFTALACKLNDAQGAYRGPAGTTMVFMTFGQPSMTEGELPEADDGDIEFSPEIPADIRATVEGFIAALGDWEVTAANNTNDDNWEVALADAEVAHANLLRKWCVPGLESQGVSYSANPRHSLDTEKLVAAAMDGDRCRVRSLHSDASGSTSEYEYHLRLMDGEWKIENLYIVQAGRKLPTL